jgi:hypothetical protein
MTISSSTRRAGPYDCDGVDQTFSFAFKVFTAADLKATLTSPAGVDTVISSYSVTLNPDQDAAPGGLITTVATYGVGNKITISGASVETQETAIPNAGGFFPKVIEAALDKLTILVQQLRTDVDRSFRASITNPTIIDVQPAVADALLKWNSTGTGVESASSTSFTGVASGPSDVGRVPRVKPDGSFELVDSPLANGSGSTGTLELKTTPPAVEQGGLMRLRKFSGNTGVLGLPGGGVTLDINLAAAGDFSSSRTLLYVLDNWDHSRTAPGVSSSFQQGFANGGLPYGSDADWYEWSQNHYMISTNNKRLGGWALCTINAGAVDSVTLQLGGRGYNTAPAVTFIPRNGGPGSGATATTTITGGAVPLYYIVVTNGGSGYTSAPTVTISGGGGSGATAAAVLRQGVVTGIHLFNKGSGYTSTPTVSITGGGGSGAAATAFQDRSVTGITLGVGGSGYTQAPFVQIAAGGNDQLDAGPTMLLARDIMNPAVNSPCGDLGFAGRLTGSTSVDAYYAGINAQILDPNPLDPRGRLGLATVSAGVFGPTENTTRVYVELGVILGDETGQSEGGDLGKRTLNADALAADRIFAGARAGGLPAGIFHSLSGEKATAAGEEVLRVGFKTGTYQGTSFFAANGAGWNAADAAMKIGTVTATGRSINAGGSINASGADFAEYVRLRDDCGPVAPGDIVGIDSHGEVTDQHALAHSFMVVSTKPAFVGNDVADDPSRYALLSFAGQVPVNFKGARSGEFVRACSSVTGGIVPAAASTSSDETIVGRVWRVLDDGRAWVKVI